ncbi:hypothetical protein DOY81_006548 [Sarcophaga bullata]|nr:hypothetical protein DOY81_006548 [Sarcophaga bullata]
MRRKLKFYDIKPHYLDEKLMPQPIAVLECGMLCLLIEVHLPQLQLKNLELSYGLSHLS